jgi:transcriptional regulator with XRE-family HTH domain
MSATFGQELKLRRLERGLSLAQLAALVPCHRGYIGQLEHGARRPSIALARRLDEVLGRVCLAVSDRLAVA